MEHEQYGEDRAKYAKKLLSTLEKKEITGSEIKGMTASGSGNIANFITLIIKLGILSKPFCPTIQFGGCRPPNLKRTFGGSA